MGSSASAGARHFSHYLSFGISLVLLGGMCAYLWACARDRDPAVESQFGPFALCCLAYALLMADPTRHVLQHWNIWPAPGSSQYRADCAAEVEGFVCLSAVGWLFTVVATYAGSVALFAASMWNARLCKQISKIRQQWSKIRGDSCSAVYSGADRVTFPSAHRSLNSSSAASVVPALNAAAFASDSSIVDIAEGDESLASPITTAADSRIAPLGMDQLS